jgi:uncharacterized membrane protein HdeD (DUF308 family)
MATGFLVLLLGCLALATPLFAERSVPLVLGLLLVVSGVLQIGRGFTEYDRRVANPAFLGGAVSILAGLLFIARPKLAFTGLAVLLGLSFLINGLVEMLAALRRRDQAGWTWSLIDGLVNVVLGVSIAIQWPLTGEWTLGLYVAVRLIAAGWLMVVGRVEASTGPQAGAAEPHPDSRLQLPPHPEVATLRSALDAEAQQRQGTDRYWRLTFILTFFAIHVGRMDAEWNLVGLASPAVAAAGDVCFALLLTFGLVLPLRLAWRALTRPIERRAWAGLLARIDQGRGPGLFYRMVRWWLVRRLRFSLRVRAARHSPTGAVGLALQIGLPLTAILIALNPIWGFSWYFNTENWATEAWAQWAEHRTDTWREEMVKAVREEYRGTSLPPANLFQVAPEGIAGEGDFSFLVIGDPGEGDESQQSLRDQYLRLGQQPEVKFLVISSDVIYPAGAMHDYESKFYLPFKGFTKPIYAIPGNHDWYDALEGFTANFFESGAARAAMRARRRVDHGLTTTTEARIEGMIDEAARLRQEYGVLTGKQFAPFFEVQTDRFALIVVDTGILRSIDPEQMQWLRDALERSRGRFKMVILGHPLFAAGRYQGEGDEPFAAIHHLLREQEADVVMAGDYHSLEFYREVYPSQGKDRPMLHFVNGGGGAYLSIGTPLDWPKQPAVADCAFYPTTEAMTAKLDSQTPAWKWPLWWWVKRLGGWPSSPEALASAFDFNRAPFFQSFVEVRVERSANVVRFLPHGVNGRLRWRDFQVHGHVIPQGEGHNAAAEFRIPLPVVPPEGGP